MTQQTWEKIRERKKVKDEMNVSKTRAKKIELQILLKRHIEGISVEWYTRGACHSHFLGGPE